MSIDQTAGIAQAYSWLRAMSGGKLTQSQVDAGDAIIASNGLPVFAKLIGFTLSDSAQRDISELGFQIIREFEGLRLEAYKDTGGVWTIGYGTIKYPNGERVKQGDVCTKGQAELWLINDSKWVDACLDKYVKTKINQNQFDALASFVYNIGESAFTKSTMLNLINQSKLNDAANQFDRWIYDNGKVVEGLKNRRAKEKQLFLK
ncbi:lysozyme [Acinetobacter sp. WCHAc060033]|uniref:lysozyme n=1 Tax=Acinetobacter sp. WCHAc060033 TaxID=2518624 RepID=UPI00102383EB|nr:lysozyme [Acinetobacter sp. WCHAc060033]RZG78363.1 lysozyme [Acinetobacter sp. WCHAc060033]